MATPDLAALLPSWELSLRAERKSPATIKVYGDGVRRFLTWCEATGRTPELTRRVVAEFVADLLEAGAEPATARSRYLSLRRFTVWLVEERELRDDPLVVKAASGGAAEVLLREARGADLLVVGNRGYGGFTSVLLGSVSLQCALHGPCPVVIVRAPSRTEVDDHARRESVPAPAGT